MSKVRNWKRTSLEGGTLVSTGRCEDVNWTTFLDPATSYKTTVYVMETWEPLDDEHGHENHRGPVQRGTTSGRVEVARPKGSKTGWCVRLFGEELSERFDSKGHAQHAAEGLVVL